MDNQLDGSGIITPDISLGVFDTGESVDITIHMPRNPDIRKHASLSMLYILSILTLERQGFVQEAADHFLADGPMNEVDCWNAIGLLLKDSENDHPV